MTDKLIYGIISRLSREVEASDEKRGVAQLVARVVWDHEAASSSLVAPTKDEGPLAQLVRAVGS